MYFEERVEAWFRLNLLLIHGIAMLMDLCSFAIELYLAMLFFNQYLCRGKINLVPCTEGMFRNS